MRNDYFTLVLTLMSIFILAVAVGAETPQGSYVKTGDLQVGSGSAIYFSDGTKQITAPKSATPGAMYMAQGAVAVPISSSASGTTFNLIGPIVTVTTNGTQNVFISATAVLGSSSAGGASGLNLSICDFTSLQVLGSSYPSNIRVAQNTAVPMTVTYVVSTPSAGTHSYALCGGTNSANWNVQGNATITANVF